MNRAIHGDVVAVQLIGPNEGKVVGVLQRNWRDYVASIKKDQNDSEYCLCQTLDSRIPPIRIKTRQKERLMNSRIIVRIESWDADSKYPSGFYVQTLGEIGDLNTETEALLREHQIPHDDFSKDALSQIPTENPWIPSTKQRRDLRKELILSVDPIGCEDIDDALSYKELKNGNVQIGVHIADVSAFFQHDSPLDLEARKRSTTIYLIDRRLDMLPTILSTDIISLRQKCDKYAVSVIWEFTPKGDVISQWYGRTLINSSYALHYDQASDIMQNIETEPIHLKSRNWSSAVVDSQDLPRVKESLIGLTTFARILKKQRDGKGALELQSLDEIQISVDPGSKPIKIETHDDIEIHHTIAEWMIYANHCVASIIYEKFPDTALLRRHSFPTKENFENLLMTAKSKGFEINIESNALLAESLEKAVDPKDPNVNLLLRSLATRAMTEAEYFSTGTCTREEFYHYGLALNFYTHFTSPIRRYADVLVHRQLLQDKPLMSTQQMNEIAHYINDRHRESKYIQTESNDWFAAMYFQNTGKIVEEGIIYAIKKNMMSIFVPAYRLKSNVFLTDKKDVLILPDLVKKRDDLTGSVVVMDDGIKVTWDKEYTFKLFDHVKVGISCSEFREHRPRIQFSLSTFDVIQTKQIGGVSKSELNKVYAKSNEIHGKKTKSVWKDGIQVEVEEKNIIYKTLQGVVEKVDNSVVSGTMTIDLEDLPEKEDLNDKLAKCQKRLDEIEKIKFRLQNGGTITPKEQEKLDTEDRYRKNLIKIQRKIKK